MCVCWGEGENSWEGLENVSKKMKKISEKCTNFKELGGIWENRLILLLKIVVRVTVGYRVANIRKMEWGARTISGGRAYVPVVHYRPNVKVMFGEENGLYGDL